MKTEIWKAAKLLLAHYHQEGNHQSLDNTISFPAESTNSSERKVRTKKRLDGLLKFYYRDAA